MQFSMCVLYTFSFRVSNSLLFLSVKFNSGQKFPKIPEGWLPLSTSLTVQGYVALQGVIGVSEWIICLEIDMRLQ